MTFRKETLVWAIFGAQDLGFQTPPLPPRSATSVPKSHAPRDAALPASTPSEIQITAEQILREAKDRQEPELFVPPKQKITDPQELKSYQVRAPAVPSPAMEWDVEGSMGHFVCWGRRAPPTHFCCYPCHTAPSPKRLVPRHFTRAFSVATG